MKFKRSTTFAILVLALALTFFTVYAGLTFRGASASVGSVHFSWDYSGAGNGDGVALVVNLSGDNLSYDCINPSGKNIAPGQSGVSVSKSFYETYEADRNGRVKGSNSYEVFDSVCKDKWSITNQAGDVYVDFYLQINGVTQDSASFVCNMANVGSACTELP